MICSRTFGCTVGILQGQSTSPPSRLRGINRRRDIQRPLLVARRPWPMPTHNSPCSGNAKMIDLTGYSLDSRAGRAQRQQDAACTFTSLKGEGMEVSGADRDCRPRNALIQRVDDVGTTSESPSSQSRLACRGGCGWSARMFDHAACAASGDTCLSSRCPDRLHA